MRSEPDRQVEVEIAKSKAHIDELVVQERTGLGSLLLQWVLILPFLTFAVWKWGWVVAAGAGGVALFTSSRALRRYLQARHDLAEARREMATLELSR